MSRTDCIQNAKAVMILTEDFTQNAYVCPKCGHYMKIGAYERIKMVFDAQTFEEWD